MSHVNNSSLNGRITERPVLRVDLEPDGVTQYGMSFSVGLLPRAIELIHRVFPEGRAQGVFGSGVIVGGWFCAPLLGSWMVILQPDPMEITLDGRPLAAKEFLVMLVTTLDRFFLRLRPFWGVKPPPYVYGGRGWGSAGPRWHCSRFSTVVHQPGFTRTSDIRVIMSDTSNCG
jgi:hypothetical protein